MTIEKIIEYAILCDNLDAVKALMPLYMLPDVKGHHFGKIEWLLYKSIYNTDRYTNKSRFKQKCFKYFLDIYNNFYMFIWDKN